MNKSRVPVAYVLMVTGLATIYFLAPTSETNDQGCSIQMVQAASVDKIAITEWVSYLDTEYGFELTIPANWEAIITIDQDQPYAEPEKIVRRHIFHGSEGMVYLDLMLNNNMDLFEWLKWYGMTTAPPGEATAPLPELKPNATIAGYPAIAFIEKHETMNMLSVFFSDGVIVYRFLYTISYYEAGLQVVRTMLDSLKLFLQPAVRVNIPEDLWQEAILLAKKSGVSPTVENCCGLSSPNNPFPCCDPKGNCTWYVYYRYGSVPFTGHAKTWWGQAPLLPGWARDITPCMYQRNIAWWSTGDLGHVAYIPFYTGGTPTIWEMNWCATCARQRPTGLPNPQGYIFENNPCCYDPSKCPLRNEN